MVDITVDSSLMQNHVAGHPLSAQRFLVTLCAADQSPILLALDDAGKLTVSLRSDAQTTGWTRIDLTAQLAGADKLGSAPVVQCFTAAQNVDGTLWVVLAAADAPTKDSKVFLSRALPNTGDAADWADFAQGLIPRSDGLPAGLVFDEMILGNGDDQLGAPHIVGVGMLGGKMLHYMINPDPDDPTWVTDQFILPQNSTACLAVASGNISGLGRGVYALCSLQTLTNLTFTTFPFADSSGALQTVSRQLSLPAGYTPNTVAALAALPVREGLTELYLSGAGLHRYPLSAQGKPAQPPLQIADAASFTGTSQLLVSCCCPDESVPPCIDVWALNNADLLVTTTGTLDPTGSAYTWQQPLKLGNEVTALAAYRAQGPDGSTGPAALALGRSDGSLALMTKEASSSLWTTQTASVQVQDAALVLSTFTTRIVVTDDDGMPLNGQTVLIQPSVDAPALVNTQYVALKAAVAKPVVCDNAGVVTVVLETADLTAPIYRISVPDSDSSQDHDPAVLPKQQLRDITSGSQIANGKRCDGSQLFDDPDDPQVKENCDTAAGGIEQLMVIHDQMAQLQRIGGRAGAQQAGVVPCSPHFRAYTAERTGGGFSAVRGKTKTAEHASPGEQGVVELIESAGDLLYSALQDLLEVGKWSIDYVVGLGYQFAVNLGDELLGFVIEIAEHAIAAINFVLRATLGFDLDDLIDWLGFLFHWDSILTTHRVIAHVVDLGFSRAVDTLVDIKGGVADLFSGARALMVDDKVLVDQSDQYFRDRAREVPDSGDARTRSAHANWGYQQLSGNIAGATVDPLDFDPLNVFTDITQDEIDIIDNAVSAAAPIIADNLAAFDYAQVLDTVLDVFATLVLDTAENVSMTVLDAMATLVGYARDMFTARWDIPVLTWLYEQVICQNDGSKLTFLDTIALVTSVGATAMWRGITGEDPFPPDTVDAIMAATTWDELMAALTEDVPAGTVRALAGARDRKAAGGVDPVVAMRAASVMLVLAAIPRAFGTAFFWLKAYDKNYADCLGKWILGLDWAGWVFTVVNTEVVIAARPQDAEIERGQIDRALVWYGITTRLKDTGVLCYAWKKGAEAAEPLDAAMSAVESGIGMANMITAAISFSLEVDEQMPQDEDDAEVWRDLINLKFTQNLMSGLSAMFAFTNAMPDNPWKTLAVVTRCLAQGAKAGGALGLAGVGAVNRESDTGA